MCETILVRLRLSLNLFKGGVGLIVLPFFKLEMLIEVVAAYPSYSGFSTAIVGPLLARRFLLETLPLFKLLLEEF